MHMSLAPFRHRRYGFALASFCLLIVLLLTLFVSTFVGAPKTEAANNSVGYCKALLKQEGASDKDLEEAIRDKNTDKIEYTGYMQCKTAYDRMYKPHTDDEYNKLCSSNIKVKDGDVTITLTNEGWCNLGREQGNKDGQKDRQAAPGGSSVPSDSVLAEMGRRADKCQAGSPEMVYACIAGYVNGYKKEANKGGLSKGDICKAGGSLKVGTTTYKVTSGTVSNCNTGYTKGQADRRAGVTVPNHSTNPIVPLVPEPDEPTTTDPEDDLDENDDCDFKFYNPLTWVVCPIIDGVNTAVDQLDTAINTLLTVNTARVFDTSDTEGSGYAYMKAWNSFRVIGIAIIVISAMVVIISSAFGFEILDAYTIRKTLPRLLIALLVITLSWDILYFLVSLSNDVGNGVRWIIYQPFSQMEDLELGQGSLLISNLLLGVGVFTLGILGALSFGVTALLAALIAFMVLILRELIIIFLVIIAPIGIACMILPNTRKVWDIWQKMLISMLVAFPIIAGIIAIGRVFSTTVYANGEASGLEEIIAFVAYLLPYFLLPFAFRLAGGLMATLGGIANDQSRGGFDRLKNFRQGRMQKIHDKRMSGNSWVGKGRTGNLYRRAAAGGEHGSWSPTRRGRSRWQEEKQKRLDAQEAEMAKTGGSARAFNDDRASDLAAQGLSRRQFVQRYAEEHQAAEAAAGRVISNQEATRAAEAALTRAEQGTGVQMGSDAMSVAAMKFRLSSTNTAYGAGEAEMERMRGDVQRLRDRGLITTHDAVGWMKSNRGRADYSSNAYGATVDFLEGRQTGAQHLAGAFEGADPRDVLGSHQNTVMAFAEQAQTNLTTAVADLQAARLTGNTTAIDAAQVQVDKRMADVANIHSALSSVSPKKGDEFADTVLSQDSGLTITRRRVRRNGAGDAIVVTDTAGNPVMRQVMDSQGRPVMRNVTGADGVSRQEHVMEEVVEYEEYQERTTNRQYIDELRSNEAEHGAFHDRSREYASARQAAAAAAGTPPVPTPDP